MQMNETDKTRLAEDILSHYTPQAPTPLDRLKALDRKVKAPALRFAWCFGILASLVLGAGMSLMMTDLGSALGLADPMLPGVAVGLVGLLLAVLNYPIYHALLTRRRRKYASEILALSEALAES